MVKNLVLLWQSGYSNSKPMVSVTISMGLYYLRREKRQMGEKPANVNVKKALPRRLQTLFRRWKMVENTNWIDVTFTTSKQRWGERIKVDSTWKQRWLIDVHSTFVETNVKTAFVRPCWNDVYNTLSTSRAFLRPTYNVETTLVDWRSFNVFWDKRWNNVVYQLRYDYFSLVMF